MTCPHKRSGKWATDIVNMTRNQKLNNSPFGEWAIVVLPYLKLQFYSALSVFYKYSLNAFLLFLGLHP